MLDSASERPGGGAPRRRRARIGWAASLLLVAAAAGVPWAVPQVATSLAEVADAIVPGPEATPLLPTAVQVPAVPVPGEASTGPATVGGGSSGVPRVLVIPTLGVRAAVAPVSGRTGELSPPDDPRVAGWWQEGASAGSGTGSVVVVGHTVRAGGGVFDDLGDLRPGDDVSLRTGRGWVKFDVTETRALAVDQLARQAAVLFTRTGPGRLVLVTCTDFDGEVYRARTVVVADPVDPVGVSRAAGSPG